MIVIASTNLSSYHLVCAAGNWQVEYSCILLGVFSWASYLLRCSLLEMSSVHFVLLDATLYLTSEAQLNFGLQFTLWPHRLIGSAALLAAVHLGLFFFLQEGLFESLEADSGLLEPLCNLHTHWPIQDVINVWCIFWDVGVNISCCIGIKDQFSQG